MTFITPKKHQDQVRSIDKDIVRFYPLDRVKIGKLMIINFLGWGIYFLQAYLLASALSIHVDFHFLVICLSISGLITLLPVTISGIGTRDTVFILMFDKMGESSESALAFSFLLLLTYFINGFFGFIAFQLKPLGSQTKQDLLNEENRVE